MHSTTTRISAILATAMACSFAIGCGGPGNAELMETLNLDTTPCIATFTESYQATDFFGDPEFSVDAGESFILSGINDWSGSTKATLLYLFDAGAHDFEIEIEGEDLSDLPFEMSCDASAGVSRLGVFKDVTVYADENLTEEVCTLTRGQSATVNSGTGYSLVSGLFETPVIYRVYLAGFSESCNQLEEGYLEAETAYVFGSSTPLIPLKRYMATH